MPENNETIELGGAQAWWIWILAVTFVIFLFSIQTGYAVTSSSIQGELTLTATQIATIAATYTWVMAIFQFYGGALLDQLGVRKVLPTSIALVTLGVFMFANAETFHMLLVSQTILAIGSCTGFVGAGYIGGQWFGMARFSFMFGLVQVASAAASAFSQNAIGFALSQMEWRELFNYVGMFGVVLFVVGAVYIRNPAPVAAVAANGVIDFLTRVTHSLINVAKSVHVWVASLWGALTFGTLLSLGIVWGPKLLMVRGADEATAVLGSSLIWLGLAAGSCIVPWWSDRLRQRKLPIILGSLVQLVCLVLLIYVADLGNTIDLMLFFIFGFANSSHMLAFSTVADTVEPHKIGTSAAIVNGIMFIFGGLLIARPGIRIDRALDLGLEPGAMDLAQYAALPLVVAISLGLVLALAMKETYPDNY